MGKKHNPGGCQCCGKVLIWDMGLPLVQFVQPGDFYRRDGYGFGRYEIVDEVMEGLGVEVHRAIPASLLEAATSNAPPAFSGDIYGLNFWADNPGFDPYDVETNQELYEGTWTGNINDYRLVLWSFPLSGTNNQLSGPCPAQVNSFYGPFSECIPDGAADHEFFAGLPDWWEAIENSQWPGRLWITTGESMTFVSIFISSEPLVVLHECSYYVNLFLEESGVFNHIGMSIPAASGQFSYGGGGVTKECGLFFNERPDPTPVAADLTSGALGSVTGSAVPITGGQPLYTQESPQLYLGCGGVPGGGADCATAVAAARNRVETAGGLWQDFVLSMFRLTDDPAFVQNAFEVRIAEDPDVSGG